MQTGPAVARGGDPKNRDLIRRTASLLSTPMPLHEALRHFSDLLATFIDGSYVSIAVDDGHETGRQFAFLRGVEIGPGAPNVPTESGSALSVPISFGGDVVGTLNVRSVRADAYGADDLALLESCAVFVGARIHDEARRVDREHLLQMAFTDALTGLANRRSYDEALEREWRRCARSGTPLSLLMLDVDFFKIYNDAYGHIAGDGCLKQIARAVAGCAKRPGDLAARYGGEEFAVILPETTAEEAMAVAEEIVAAVRSLELPHQGSSLGYATVPKSSTVPPPMGTRSTVPPS